MEIQIRRSVANCQKPDEQNKRFFIAEKGGFCQKKKIANSPRNKEKLCKYQVDCASF